MSEIPDPPDTENGTKMWAWNEETQQWYLCGEAPALPPLPDPNKAYYWNPEIQQWVEYTGA